jgi:hypothetical protein
MINIETPDITINVVQVVKIVGAIFGIFVIGTIFGWIGDRIK